MGRILIAHDERLDRDIVIKELLADCGDASHEAQLPSPFQRSSPAITRFIREARVTGQLEHPAIVPVHELGRREDGTLYYTMKQIQGISFSEAIRRAEDLKERLELLPHFLDLCQAVAYAHSRGVIHRDIKPGNVMVGEFGETVLLDWGLAKVLGQEDLHGRFIERSVGALDPGRSTDATVTAFGQVLGTPVYMAPEQARAESAQVDEGTDVYGLGAVLYTLLTGRAPFHAERSDDILAQVIDEEPQPVLEVAPSVPPELASICLKAMAKAPSKRYPSAKELAQEIQQYLSGGLVGAYRYGLPEHLWRFARRFKAVLVTAAAALLLLLAVGIYSYIRILNEVDIAVEARQAAETERAAAEAAEARAVEEAENAELEQYYRTISLAASWLESGRKGEVADLLMSAPERLRNWEWGYLLSKCQREEHRVQAHEHSTGEFALSPDGKWLVSHSQMNVRGDKCQIVLWDAETMKERWRRDVDYRSAGVAIHPENTLIAVGGWDSPLMVYDMETGEERVRLGPHDRRFSLCFSPDGEMLVEANSHAGAIVVRRTQDWEVISRFGEASPTTSTRASLAFSPNGRLFASGNCDGRIAVRDTDSWAPIWEFQGHDDPITSLVFDSTSTRLVSASWGNQVPIWDIDKKTEESVLPLGFDSPLSLAYVAIAPDDSRLFVASRGGVVRCVRLSDGEVLGTLETRGQVHPFSCSFELERVYVGNGQGRISCWRFESILDAGQETKPLAALTGGGRRVCCSLDGKFILGCYMDGQIEIWNADTFERVGALTPGSGAKVSVACFRPGTHEVLVASPGTARFYRIPDMNVTNEIPVKNELNSATFDVSGRLLLVADRLAEDPEVGSHTLWDLERRQTLVKDYVPPFGMSQGPISAISRDGKRAAIGARGMTDVGVLQLPEGELLYIATDLYGPPRSFAFHPDSRIFAMGDSRRHIYIRTTESPDLRGFLTGHRAEVSCLAFSPDGNRLLSGSGDATYRLWDWRTGQELLSFTEPGADVWAPDVAFSPDGLSIVLTGVDPPFRVLQALPWREPDPTLNDSDDGGLTNAH
jgi:WD40 repeat protein